MQARSTRAILLRRIAYGDNDLIVTLFTPDAGRLTVIAKAARKSKRRFPGILELFSLLEVVYSKGQRGNLPMLKEAVLENAFIHIRNDILKTGYANYWVELINIWLPEGKEDPALYLLLKEVLLALDKSCISSQILTIYFQMKFLNFAGLKPSLDACCLCQIQTGVLDQKKVSLSLRDGGIVCCRCQPSVSANINFTLSKGTLKQLIWISERNLSTAVRVRFSAAGLKEALEFLESFVPYHVGKVPKSLTFLRNMRTYNTV
ncbi:MAG: DNA repair protein RecO [Desulfobacteraceae bacterium]|jgi:DNA repair protein RecO (recombination protein O)